MNTHAKTTQYTFSHYRFDELPNVTLYGALKLRSDVFVVEQNCVYPDLDDKDIHPSALHILCDSEVNSSEGGSSMVSSSEVDKSKPYNTSASKSLHLAEHEQKLSNSKNIVAYARCLAPGVSYAGSSIGRVAVAENARGQGLAKLLMLEAISVCKQQWPDSHIQIGAQVYLQAFYQQLGFTAFSEPYDEDGIMHIDMQLV